MFLNSLPEAVVKGKSLIVLPSKDEIVKKSSSNVPNIKVIEVKYLNYFDLLKYDFLVLLKGSISFVDSEFEKE